MKNIYLSFLIVFPFFCLNAQLSLQTNKAEANAWQHFESSDLSIDAFFEKEQINLGIDKHSKFRQSLRSEGKNGYVHYRFKQSYKGVPVFGGSYNLHEKNGKLVTANGRYASLKDKSIVPTISSDLVIHTAKEKMRNEKSASESVGTQKNISIVDEPTLIFIDKAFPKFSNSTLLAWQVDVICEKPYDKQRFIFDAHNGTLLTKLPLIHASSVPGTGKSTYYGIQDIVVDSVAPNEFTLFDDTRGQGITTFNDGMVPFVSSSSNFDYSNEKNGGAAVDAHYCTEKFYDMMLEKLGWDGLDDLGLSMNPVVHLGGGVDYVNAFWNGQNAFFGDGSCNHGPLTTLTVVGHEFMHGITDYTSNLIYSDESGAINESMSDIFGKSLEYFEDSDNFTWYIGDRFIETDLVEPFRSMEDPNMFSHPKYYGGEFWFDGGGVHTNSSIGNHWFYLLASGQNGTNEVGYNYNIEGLGIEKAMLVAWGSQRDYLVESSNYRDFFESSLLVAEELFGANSSEYDDVVEAWKAVGLFDDNTNEPIIDLSITVEDNVVNTCVLEDFFTVELLLRNTGNTDFIPTGNEFVNLQYQSSNGSELKQIEITESLSPGEQTVVIVEGFFYLDEIANYFLNFDITIIDDVFSNNNGYLFASNGISSDPDLELRAYFDEASCFSSVIDFTFYVENSSCSDFPLDTPFQIEIKDDLENVIYTLDTVFTFDIPQNFTVGINKSIDLGFTESGPISVELLYPDDSNLSNNNFTGVIQLADESINSEYYNDVESFNDLSGSLNLTTYSGDNFYTYQNDNYLVSTGLNPINLTNLCPKAEENFDGDLAYGNVNTIVSSCLDLQGMQGPTLAFDLVQFSNENFPFEQYSEISSMMKVSWVGTDSGEVYITNQEEGSVVHHDYLLPSDFVGELIFEFFTNTGVDINDSDFLAYDVVLLDDIEIYSDPTNTEDLRSESVAIFPNPVREALTIKSDIKIDNIQIFSIDGVNVMSQKVDALERVISMEGLENGYYLISLSSGTDTVTKSFIRMKK